MAWTLRFGMGSALVGMLVVGLMMVSLGGADARSVEFASAPALAPAAAMAGAAAAMGCFMSTHVLIAIFTVAVLVMGAEAAEFAPAPAPNTGHGIALLPSLATSAVIGLLTFGMSKFL